MEYISLSKIYYSNKSHYEEIYEKRYTSESSYRFDFSISGNSAFLLLTPELFRLTDKISELNTTLNELCYKVPHIAIDQYTRKCLVDEIQITNDIEGVVSTRHEINDALNEYSSGVSKAKKRFRGLVSKYALLLERDEIPLKKCKDIRELYNDFVLEEVLEEDKTNLPDGLYFRKERVYVNNKHGKAIHEGLYPEEEIIEMMEQSLALLNDDSFSFLIRIAIFHYLFAYIHPFYDGNGRMTRFISSYLLSKKLNDLTCFRLSYTIKKNLAKYYKSFKITNDPKNKGDLTPFVTNFFEILVILVQDLCDSIEKRFEKYKHYTALAEQHTLSKDKDYRLLKILISNTLFGDEGLSAGTLAKIAKASVSTVRNIIAVYNNAGLLSVEKDGKYKLYDVNLDKL